jgi:hypothetical protein
VPNHHGRTILAHGPEQHLPHRIVLNSNIGRQQIEPGPPDRGPDARGVLTYGLANHLRINETT